MIQKNKRGDIPITILVIGVFALCSLAILSFVISKQAAQDNVLGAEVIEKINSDVEEFRFYTNAGLSEEEAAEKVNATISGRRLIFERSKGVREGGFIGGIEREKIRIKYIVDLSDI